jgi:hypothetical protein
VFLDRSNTKAIEELKDRLVKRCVRDRRTNCWVWRGARNKQGYGIVKFRKRFYRVHRLFFSVFKGFDIDSDLFVNHYCNNTSCVNPDHLTAKNQEDNMKYASNLDRTQRGERSPASKLTQSEVRKIRKLAGENELSKQKIGDMFGISRRHVYYLMNHERWKHLKSVSKRKPEI